MSWRRRGGGRRGTSGAARALCFDCGRVDPSPTTHSSACTSSSGTVPPGTVLPPFLGACLPCSPWEQPLGRGRAQAVTRVSVAQASGPDHRRLEGRAQESLFFFCRGWFFSSAWLWLFALGEGGRPVGHGEWCYLLESPGSPRDSLPQPTVMEHLLGAGPCSRQQGPGSAETCQRPRGSDGARLR